MRLRFTQASLDEVGQYSVAEIGEIVIIVEEAECAAAEACAMDLDQTFGNLFRGADQGISRSEEHTSELQSLMRISYAVFCVKKKKVRQRKTVKSIKRENTQHNQ